MGYTKEAVRGITFIGLIRVITRLLSFIKTVIIARILSPYQFGLFGIATLVLVFVEILTETGVNIFLVQKRNNIDEYINTAFIVSIIRGFVIGLIIFISSAFVAKFFKAPSSYSLLLLISLVPILRGFINPSIVKFQKELRFSTEFYYRSGTFFIETFFSILLIILIKSVEGLVFGMIIGVFFEILLSHLIAKPRPAFSFNPMIFKEVLGFGKWITASTIFNYFYQHGDDMAVGRILGTGSLGIYDMAYRISLIPITDIADVVFRVTFPVYVKISGDIMRLRRAFVRSLVFVILLVLPICSVLFFFPERIVSLILGNKWLEIVPVLKVLAIFGVIRAISVYSSTIFLSLEKQSLVTLISLVGLSGLLVTIVPFVLMWGIVGASFSALFGTSLTIPVIFYNIYKIFFKK